MSPEKLNGKRPEDVLPRQERGPASLGMKTIPSEFHPARNEDAMFGDKKKRFFGVLDGMGGRAAGDVASSKAGNYITGSLQGLPEGPSLHQTETELWRIIRGANRELLRLAEENPGFRGMGTTASIVKIWEGADGERKAVIANIGDSRVYILRASGNLEQVTLDDDISRIDAGNEQQARALQRKLSAVTHLKDLWNLGAQERNLFENRHIVSQILGRPDINPNMSVVDIFPGDKIIATTDGIHDNLTTGEIRQILIASKNNQEAAERLANAARERSRDENHLRAKGDDMTAVVFG